PSLGITVDEKLNSHLSKILDVQGVVVLNVIPGSSADKAGLKGAVMARNSAILPRDIIINLNGREISSVAQLLSALDDYKVGDVVTLQIQREQNIRQVDVELQAG
uniref:PDZ domain-containing protein n=1 Tax=Neptunomonas sp. TaxID=1971898 RepID=UPI00356AA194